MHVRRGLVYPLSPLGYVEGDARHAIKGLHKRDEAVSMANLASLALYPRKGLAIECLHKAK